MKLNSTSKLYWVKAAPREWLGSELRLLMTALERGVYRDAFDLCLTEGSLPADPRLLARVLAISDDELDSAWPRVSEEFDSDPSTPGRLISHAARAIVDEANRYRQKQAANGRKGGRPRSQAEPDESKTQTESEPEATSKAGPKPVGFPVEKPNNTEQNNTEQNKALGSPHGDQVSAGAEVTTEECDRRFAAWWKQYPRKVKKTLAEGNWARLWRRSKVDIDLLEKNSPFWFDEFRERPDDKIPHPPTFINSRAWEEPPPPPGKPAARRLTGYEEAMERLRRKDAAEQQATASRALVG